MVKQIRMLTRIQLCNLFGWNEFRHTKDRKKASNYKLMVVVWSFLILIMEVYVFLISYELCKQGFAQIIPQILAFIVSLIILFFTILKAGNDIFQKKAFEMQMSLPVNKTAIIVSRFLTMYVTELFISILIMFPGLIMYNVYEDTTFTFWLFGIIEMLLLPLLPLTVATIIGAGIIAITAKWKHRNAIVTGFTLLFLTGWIVVSMGANQITDQAMEDFIKKTFEMLGKKTAAIYPPAVWIGDAIVNGDILAFVMYAGTSVVLFVLMIWVLQKHFLSICTALESNYHNEGFTITRMDSSSMLKALWRKELKRYFASSIYVTNTIIGNIMTVILAISVLVMGVDEVGQMFGMEISIGHLLPILLGAIAIMTPMTTCSISIEGKQWWIVNTLPIPMKMLRRGKVLASLSVALPFYLISGVITLIAVKPNLLGAIWIIIIPALYIIFGTYAGITINEKFPRFDWESEAQVVKQGTPIILMLLVTALVAMVPCGLLIVLPQSMADVILVVVSLVLLLGILLLKNKK